MLEIAFLIIATSGIAAFARGRGGNTYLWGTMTAGGYLFIAYLLPRFFPPITDPEGTRYLFFAAAIAWVGAIAFCARYLLGSRRKEKPSGMWTCPECKYLNQRYAVQCEACKRPYGKTASIG